MLMSFIHDYNKLIKKFVTVMDEQTCSQIISNVAKVRKKSKIMGKADTDFLC